MTIDLKEARRVAVDFGTCFPTFEQNANASHEWSKIWEDADFCLALLDHAEAQAAQVAALTAKLEAPEWSGDTPEPGDYRLALPTEPKHCLAQITHRHGVTTIATTIGHYTALAEFLLSNAECLWLRIETP